MKSQREKGEIFEQLHRRDHAFIIPNPWDAGSAKMLQALGFEALATTSSGFANALAKMDGEVTLAEKLAHCRGLCEVTDIPISVDFENGFADDPEKVAANVLRLAETGVVGCSIEDFGNGRIYEFNAAVERVEAAVEAAHGLPFAFTLTARAENLLHGVSDMDDTIRRLHAFEMVGADVLYAPGLHSMEQVKRVLAEVGKPINVLWPFMPGATMAEFEEAGVRRVSIGGALARHAMTATATTSKEMLGKGTFDAFTGLMPSSEVQRMFQGN